MIETLITKPTKGEAVIVSQWKIIDEPKLKDLKGQELYVSSHWTTNFGDYYAERHLQSDLEFYETQVSRKCMSQTFVLVGVKESFSNFGDEV